MFYVLKRLIRIEKIIFSSIVSIKTNLIQHKHRQIIYENDDNSSKKSQVIKLK